MDSLETKPPDPAASATADVPGAISGSCWAPASAAQLSQGARLSWIREWRVLGVAALAITGTGLVVGWKWLTAVGIAPIIVSAAPCLIMCALGVCTMRRGHKSSSIDPAPEPIETPTRSDPLGSP